MTCGWMTEACLYYKLAHEPEGSGELKIEHLFYSMQMQMGTGCGN